MGFQYFLPDLLTPVFHGFTWNFQIVLVGGVLHLPTPPGRYVPVHSFYPWGETVIIAAVFRHVRVADLVYLKLLNLSSNPAQQN
jgi:hypothetical protein